MNYQTISFLLNWGPFLFLVLLFILVLFILNKLTRKTKDVVIDVYENGKKGDDLSLEIARSAKILAHYYLYSLIGVALLSLYLHKIIFTLGVPFLEDLVKRDLMVTLVILSGLFFLGIQTILSLGKSNQQVKNLSLFFQIPIRNMKNYSLALIFGIFWLCASLCNFDKDPISYAVDVILAILIPSVLFENICVKWILGSYLDEESALED